VVVAAGAVADTKSRAEADLSRLRAACGRKRVDPTRSLYGPDSVTWRINREAIILLGGGRALLLQVAHPLVAAGVAAHSNFRRAPLQRLWRTLDLMLTMTFADGLHAIAAVREIERRHARVRGTLDDDVGPFPRGTAYAANDPELLFWVHATLVDAALLVYERFVEPLPPATRRAYYEESKIGARLFGVPNRLIPRTLRDFEDYMRAMIDGDALTVGAAGKAIAASILSPPLPFGVRQILQTANFFTIGLLPEAIRARYGYTWSRPQEAAMQATATAARYGLAVLPDLVRVLPHGRRQSPAVHPGGAGRL